MKCESSQLLAIGRHFTVQTLDQLCQGSDCTGKTGKIVKSTVAALRNARAFQSAHPQSYVIAHMSFRGKLSPYKPNNR